eukprot:gene4913-5157_t
MERLGSMLPGGSGGALDSLPIFEGYNKAGELQNILIAIRLARAIRITNSGVVLRISRSSARRPYAPRLPRALMLLLPWPLR